MKKPIFFDLDGTLIEGNSWYKFNLYFGMSEKKDEVLLGWYHQGTITYNEWVDLIVKILRQKNKCTQEKITEFKRARHHLLNKHLGTIQLPPVPVYMQKCAEWNLND